MQLEKTDVRRSFAAAATHYDRVAALQRNVGDRLLYFMDRDTLSGTIMDLGCGTGFITTQILSLSANHQPLIALDIAVPMLQVMREKLFNQQQVVYLAADAEQLPLARHTIDVVISNLAFQWCDNLASVFSECKRVLKTNGQLIFSIFGPKTLQELKVAWSEVDHYQHVNDFYRPEQLSDFLRAAGYSQINMETELFNMRYCSVLQLMKELKSMGAHNINGNRSRHVMSKARMQQMTAAYQRRFAQSVETIPATYEVLFVVAS